METLSILAKNPWEIELNFSCSALLHIKTRVCPKYVAHDCKYIDLNQKLQISNLLRNSVSIYLSGKYLTKWKYSNKMD